MIKTIKFYSKKKGNVPTNSNRLWENGFNMGCLFPKFFDLDIVKKLAVNLK